MSRRKTKSHKVREYENVIITYCKERLTNDNHQDFIDLESQRTASRASFLGNKDCSDSTPMSRNLA